MHSSKLREARLASGLTLKQVADRLGMSHSQISRLERGASNYTEKTLTALAEVYGKAPGDLIGGPDDEEEFVLAPVERRRFALKRAIDERAGGSVNAFATAAGVSESTIRSFLDGAAASMTDRTYDRLAEHYSVTPAQLRGEVTAREVFPQVGENLLTQSGEQVNVPDGHNIGGTDSTTRKLKNLRIRAGLSMREMAEIMGLKGPSSYQRYEDPAMFAGFLSMEWRGPVTVALVGTGDPAITEGEVDELFGLGAQADDSLAAKVRKLRERAGLTLREVAQALDLNGPSGWRYYEAASRSERFLRAEWRTTLMGLLVGKGEPAITELEVSELFGAAAAPNLRHCGGNLGHAVLIRRAAIEAAERIVAQAGPINAAPRDIVRQIVTEVFGFQMEDGK